jgi:SNF2 family DNA or RNA helicase
MVSTAVQAQVSQKHRVFCLPYDQALMNVVPGAKQFYHPEQGPTIILPHQNDIVKLARNLGYRVPAPILNRYDWNGHIGKEHPFKTQKITAAMLTMNRRAYVLSQMGTGKTRAALHAINWLMLDGEVTRALIVAPLSTLWIVWDAEVLRYFNHLSVGVLYGDRTERAAKLAEQHDIYVINPDGLNAVLPQLLVRRDINCVVLDELGMYRTHGTDRWGNVAKLVAGRKYVWGLTGSPTPNEPADAWAQCKLLTPHSVPAHFRSFKRHTMRQISQFKWIPKDDANDLVYAAMQPGIRFKRDDCVELPPVSYQERKVKLSDQQARVYKLMMTKLRVAFTNGEVTAANEGVLFSKLLQISAGWVYTSDKQIVGLDNKDRLDQLLEIIDEADGKIIVFNEFVHAAMNLYQTLQGQRISCALVTGQTSSSDRNRVFNEFQNSSFPRVLVAHPKCMAHGLTLTSANVIAWFTPTTSNETYEQACARITRPGQTRKQLIIHLTGTPVEAKLYRRLRQRQSLQGALLELFEEQETDE